ncbi:MAG: phosphonate metabolism protein/1,5-bisphosphokinase (PRPP-forming) PhnN [Acetobacterales bacterium]
MPPADSAPRRGTLFLVVGPSGAGKDSLIAGARARLADDPSVRFVRRAITRAADAGGEDHEAATPEEFARQRAAGAYALSWEAHGLGYGIPGNVGADLAAGRNVVANVSRGVIDDARERFDPLRVVAVTAPAAVLARRLAERGRETERDIAARLARAGYAMPEGEDVEVIENAGALEDAVARFTALLTGRRR